MPVHDWTRVDAGTFHDFHSAWIIHLKETLNDGLLPAGYYAMAEQHAGRTIADVLTLATNHNGLDSAGDSGPIAVAATPPRVTRKVVASPAGAMRALRKTLTIRHVSNHRIVALLEIVSAANKDRTASVEEFVAKAPSAIKQGLHLLVVDLFPPGPHDPQGIHFAIWEFFGPDEELPRADKPLTLAAYEACPLPEAYVTPIAVGDILPDMPLFLDIGRYINVPLETTYQTAFRGVPAYWRAVVEGRESANSNS